MADIEESNINRNSSSGIMKLFGATITVTEKSSHPNNDHHHHHLLHHHDRENKRPPSDPSSIMSYKRPDKIIPCPRCKSMETKFCYFNNYNVNQPRHFCKGCQRYWTAGGALRNVPVGAGRRKVKPPCRSVTEGCMFGGSAEVEKLIDYETGVVDMEGWYVVEDGGFRHIFPAKRRRCGSNSQSC